MPTPVVVDHERHRGSLHERLAGSLQTWMAKVIAGRRPAPEDRWPPTARAGHEGMARRLDAPVTDMEVRMQESYGEGVASHPDPEPCGVAREGGAEALVGARTGEVLSREIMHFRAPTLLSEAEGHTQGGATASPCGALRGRRPCARAETPWTGTGRSHCLPRDDTWNAAERPRAVIR